MASRRKYPFIRKYPTWFTPAKRINYKGGCVVFVSGNNPICLYVFLGQLPYCKITIPLTTYYVDVCDYEFLFAVYYFFKYKLPDIDYHTKKPVLFYSVDDNYSRLQKFFQQAYSGATLCAKIKKWDVPYAIFPGTVVDFIYDKLNREPGVFALVRSDVRYMEVFFKNSTNNLNFDRWNKVLNLTQDI